MASLNLRNRYAGEVSAEFLVSVECPQAQQWLFRGWCPFQSTLLYGSVILSTDSRFLRDKGYNFPRLLNR